MRIISGSVDTTLDARTGALVIALSIDSMPRINKAQVSLLHGKEHYDAIYGDSLVRLRAPPGRYLFRAREIGAQTIQDSVEVRGSFADTVKVILGRAVVCLDAVIA
jgi:hypothetical protein